MKVVFAAYDAGPSTALFRTSQAGGGLECALFLQLAGKIAPPSNDELIRAIFAADAVVVGLSSEKTASFEIEVCQKAVAARRPLVFFSDSFGTWEREWFAPFRDYVSLVTVVVPNEVASAQALYPNAKVVATGNPAWETLHTPYVMSDQITLWRLLDARRTDFLILISGCKDEAVNHEMIETMLVAAEKFVDLRGPNYKLLFSLHPGDTTPAVQYQDWVAHHEKFQVCSSGQFVTLDSEEVRGDVAVSGVDVVVTYNASSVALRAIAHAQPVIVLKTPRALARLRAESGSEVNPLLPVAILSPDRDTGNLVATLSLAYEWRMSGDDFFVKCKADQAAFFPHVAKGAYVKAVIAAIEGVVVPKTVE